MWPSAEVEKKGFKFKPIYLIPIPIIAIVAIAFVVLAGGGSKKAAQTTSPPPPPTTAQNTQTQQTTTTPKPPASAIRASGVTFSTNGNTVIAKVSFAGGKLAKSDVTTPDANMLDGSGTVAVAATGIKSSLAKSAANGISIQISGTKDKLVIHLTAKPKKFTTLRAKVGATGRAIAIVFTLKPKPKPPVAHHNPPPPPPVVVVNPPPPPPPVVVNPPPPPPPVVVHPPPPPPPPPPSTTIQIG
jgi:ribosomal protein S12